jgi:hypothetical protein
MKSAILAGAMTLAIGTGCLANGPYPSGSFSSGLYPGGLYWVVGNRVTSKCDIVTSNPVIFADGGGDFWFGDGPYRSVADAKLARSTIGACPEKDPSK